MEDQADPTPETTDAAPAAEPGPTPERAPVEGTGEDTLAVLVEKSAKGRLAPPDEERAATLVREGLLGKKESQAETAELLPRLGWSAAVKGVTGAWPEMKAAGRAALVKTLTSTEDEASRRLRLSIARGLVTIDAPTSLKLIASVAKEITANETGTPTPRDAQNFAAVLLGKGRPWIVNLPVAEAKPAEIDLIVAAAIRVAFSAKESPVTQLGVLTWTGAAGLLDKLDEAMLGVITPVTSKWSLKWANAARKEVPNLPETIAATLKVEGAPNPDGLPAELVEEGGSAGASSSDEDDDEEDDETPGAPGQKRERPVYVSKTIPPREPREPREERAEREPKGPTPRSSDFNATDALRKIDAHINFLRSELKAAEHKLRDRPADKRKAKPDAPIIAGEPTPEELARINVQLEARVTDLQARLGELAADAEARAVSAGAFAAAPETNLDTQLRTLLGLKLSSAHADFEALEKVDRDLVIPQHYREVLKEVFAVLIAEGVPFSQPATELSEGRLSN